MDARGAIVDLIENQQEQFYRIAFAYVKNKDDALDVLHDAIVKALQNQHTLREPDYVKTWFYRILINQSISFLRKSKRVVLLEDVKELVQEASGLEQAAYVDLYDALDKLPVKLRTVVILRYFEDMKFWEIARITGSRESTVKSRLYKALSLLKVDLEVVEHDG